MSTKPGLLIPVMLVAACGGATPGAPDAQPEADVLPVSALVALDVVPHDKTIVVDDGVVVQQQYRAIATFADGSERDVTGEVSWTTYDPSLLGMDNAGLATTSAILGGQTIVRAFEGQIAGETTAIVIQRHLAIGPGAPADAPALFGAAAVDGTLGRAPALFYPSDGTIVPPNFQGLEFHFTPGTGNDLFELAVVEGYQEYRHYGGCALVGAGCGVTPDTAGWAAIAAKFIGKNPQVTVAGLRAATPGDKGVSSPRTLMLTAEELTSALYYWNATSGQLHRFDFGHPELPPVLWFTASPANYCVGCHTLSRDGTLAAIGENSPSPSQLDLVDVASKVTLWSGGYGTAQGSNYHAFSPDNSKVLTTDGYTLGVRDALTGADLGYGNLSERALFPDWSPDSSMIVYTESGSGWCTSSPCSDFTTASGKLVMRSFDAATGFGNEWDLVPWLGTHNNYYPAFTPGNDWVVFNRVSSADSFGLDSYDNRECTLWTVSPLGGDPVQLARAGGGYRGNSWPKVTPIMQPYSGGSVAFVTFSSRRPIGLRPQTDTAQIWMAAFDPDRAAMGLDPSFAAVHLPWQDQSSGNHIAQWALDIPYEPCGPMGECPKGEFCDDGECVPILE